LQCNLFVLFQVANRKTPGRDGVSLTGTDFMGMAVRKLVCKLARGQIACDKFDHSEFVFDRDEGVSLGVLQDEIADL
jgi:hypothetical protein